MADLLTAISAFQGRFSDRVSGLASQLETRNGKIVANRQNLARVSQIIGEMRGSFIDPEFTGAVAEYLTTFDATSAAVVERLKSFGPVDEEFISAITQQFKQITATELLSADAYGASLFNPIANELISGVSTGASMKRTMEAVAYRAKALEDAVTMTIEGAPVTLSRTITTVVADEVGAEFFLFQGRPIKTTRPWCREREGHVWHRKEIEKWGRDAANGNGWDGMVEGTNEKTIFIHAGGWFGDRAVCRHTFLPVHLRDVPAEDLERMKAKGLV